MFLTKLLYQHLHRVLLSICLILLTSKVSCINLQCTFDTTSWAFANGGRCVVQNLVINSPNQIVTSINSDTNFYDNSIKMIYIHGQTVHYIPKGLAKFFPDIQGIEIMNSGLKSIEKSDLQPFTNLQDLHLGSNLLETLDDDLFEFTPKVSCIILGDNKINSIGENLFDPLIKAPSRFSIDGCLSSYNSATFKSDVKKLCPYTKKCEKCLKELANVKSNRDYFELQTNITSTKQIQCESKNSDLLMELDETKEEQNALASNLTSFIVEVANLKTKLNQKSLEVLNLTRTLKESEVIIFNMSMEHRSLISSHNKLKVENKNNKNLLNTCQSNYKRVSKNNQELQKKFTKDTHDIKEKNTKKFDACDGNLNALSKFMMLSSKKLAENGISNQTIFEDHSKEPQKIDLLCKTDKDKSLCDVVKFKTEFSNLVINSVKDESGRKIDNEKIKKLRIADQQMLFLPRNLDQYFPQLTELFIVSSGLYELNMKSLGNLKNLVSLTVVGNMIRQIPAKTFINMKNLVTLDLSSNNIEFIEDGAFDGLTKLHKLKLDQNILVKLSDKVFNGSSKLKEISLQNNKLKFIGANFVTDLKELSHLDLSNNDCINTKFPKESLENIQTIIIDNCVASIELSCRFTTENTFLSNTAKSYTYLTDFTCMVQKNLTIEYPRSNFFVSGGNANDFDKVSAFIAVDQSMKYLPLLISQSFPRLEKFAVENSGLTSLQSNDFKGLNQLKMIVIRNNIDVN